MRSVSDLLRKTALRDEESETRCTIGAYPLACFGIPITLRATSDPAFSRRQRVVLCFETAFATDGRATMLALRELARDRLASRGKLKISVR